MYDSGSTDGESAYSDSDNDSDASVSSETSSTDSESADTDGSELVEEQVYTDEEYFVDDI